MPAGSESPILGNFSFVAIKFLGYVAAAKWLNRELGSNQNIWLVGLARLIIGLIFGVSAWFSAFFLSKVFGDGFIPIAYVVVLFPVRMLEWHILLRLFYRSSYLGRSKVTLLFFGALWSYLLDIPAAFGLIVVGGFWIC